MSSSQIRVSVVCNAYNHAKYIRKCLESLTTQKTSFEYEILVHDDASTDGTADIIREFEMKYPNLIKPIYQTENQYSKGGISKFQYPRAKGDYIAFCEGDDYWTDEYKLQKQFDALEAYPEIDICAHSTVKVSEDEGEILGYIAPRQKTCVIPVEDVIYNGGGFVGTNSLMYRADLEKNIPGFRQFWRIDYALQISGSLRGGMIYLPETMSAYRWFSVGSWTRNQSSDKNKLKAVLDKKIKLLNMLNEETNFKHTVIINNTINREEFLHYYYNGPFKLALSKKYKNIRRKEGLKRKLKLYIKIIFSFYFNKKSQYE